MQVKFNQVSKRYRYEWIFKEIDFSFEEGKSYAITGPNGCGKSTLMKLLSGHLSPSRGKVVFETGSKKLPIDDVYRYVSYAAPYIDLVEEFTLQEAVEFHTRFKPLQRTENGIDLIELLGFSKAKEKQVRHFSSGMKQRLKLALAICSESPLLLLDEPTTNLDKQGTEWYRSLIDLYAKGRTVVVASNVDIDFAFCEKELNIMDYK